ncbi:unnamed protein product, partial [Symbiodinium pilosum]
RSLPNPRAIYPIDAVCPLLRRPVMGAPQRLLPPLLLARFALMALARRPTNDLRQLLHDPGFTLRCEQAGLSLQPTALDGAQTAFTTVRDYSTRTFSRADAAEPSEPLHIRALCCPRLAGPAMGFLELPGRAMRWAPLPHRGTYDISSWTPMWMCMRCQRELPTARVQVPHPRPNCPNCCVPFAWEGDIRHAVERWVCSRCLVAGPAHPLALQQLACSPNTSDADRIGHVDSIGGPCAVSVPDASLPATPPHAPARNWVHAEPPPIPLPQATNSCVYMPLLLDAAGLLHGRAREAWRAHPSFVPWWHGAVTALLARPFLSVRDVQSAVEHGLLGQPNHTCERLQFFLAWCSLRAAQVTSLAALLREAGDPHEGYYLPGPLQEALLALLLG